MQPPKQPKKIKIKTKQSVTDGQCSEREYC